MPTLLEGKLFKVDAGETVKLTFGPNEPAVEYTVLEACSGRSGTWRCITHDKAFRHNWEKDGHISETTVDHVLAWFCHDHGIEVP